MPAEKPLKRWKSYAAQIEHLRGRGLIIKDAAAAERILSSVGYYRLSGYAYPFRAFAENRTLPRLDRFQEGSCFGDIVALYEFDRALRLSVLAAMEIIEPAMQTRIAHLLGRYSPQAHEESQFWHVDSLKLGKSGKKSRYDIWQEGYKKCFKRHQQKDFVKHNLNTYGCLPIWVAVEILDFGTLSKLFEGMRDGDKHSIAKDFSLQGNILASWLRGLGFMRNMAAHHTRLWNCNILEPVRVPPAMSALSALNNTRPFLYFCLMQFFIKQLNRQNDWGEKFKELLACFPQPANGAVTLADMGCVGGWQQWDLWN